MNREALGILKPLWAAEPPWIYLDVVTDDEEKWIPAVFYSTGDSQTVVRVLRGKKMRTLPRLMDEFGAALQFFDGFGENWHALKESLSYLDEWLIAARYVLVITSPEEVLADEPGELQWLIVTLNEVGEWWGEPIRDNDRFNRPAIPFHVVLRTREEQVAEVLAKFGQLPRLRVPSSGYS